MPEGSAQSHEEDGMNTRSKGVLLVLVAALLLVPASGAYAQTTGRIFGQILDDSKAAVPGATVTVTSSALQGSQVQVTDGEGMFRFLSLPPGTYKVRAELPGFKTVEQDNVQVGLDRTVTLALSMGVATVAEVVNVQAASPLVDTTSTVSGVNVNADLFNRLPVRRDFYDVTRLAPGTTQDTVGPVVYGSSGAENQYIIDGLNSTGVELGNKQKVLNFDFVQEVEVKTGGLPAEYGRATGGVVNVITKSGSNVLKGSIFGFAEGGVLQADDDTRDQRPQTETQVVNVSHRGDIGFDVGGFVIRDKLWFYGAYNHVDEGRETVIIRDLNAPGAPAIDTIVPADITRDLYAGKLTWKPGSANTLNLSIFGDPSERDGDIFQIQGPDTTWKGVNKTGATDVILKYNGVFGSNFLIEGTYGRHNEEDLIEGPGRDIANSQDLTVDPNIWTGGYSFFQDQNFSRDVYKAVVTRFFGDHEVKGGIDYEKLKADNRNFNGGAGQRIYKLPPRPTTGGAAYFRHRFYVDDRAPGYDRDNPSTWRLAVPLRSEPETDNVSWFAQDSWKVTPVLSINAGIRWERQAVGTRDGDTAFALNDNWAPRIGAIWDVTQNGRSKLYANWGRFFESIPMDINIRAFGGEVQCFCYNLSPDPNNILPDDSVRPHSLLGGLEPVDPDLKGQYLDEFLVGYEYEIRPNIVVGAKFIRRDLGRTIEDFLIPSEGNYFIANPGEGIGNEMAFYDGVHTAPAPKAKRTSTAFELTAQKRLSNNWQFLASMVFSQLEGNYDGTFQVSTGQLDPNINSAFDYADFLVNAEGDLSNDRAVQIKLDGSYEFSQGAASGLNIGVSTYWFSGYRLNAYGYSFAYQNWEYYLVPRGSLGTGPSDWEANVQVSYPVRLGNYRLNLIADVFNIFNRQAINQFDERYNLVSDGDCGGIPSAICNGDGGIATIGDSLTPAGSLSNPRQTATNPDFLKTGPDSSLRGFTGQRSIRVGVRFLW
jgi:hypothetical protein